MWLCLEPANCTVSCFHNDSVVVDVVLCGFSAEPLPGIELLNYCDPLLLASSHVC